MAARALDQGGIEPVIITGRDSPAVRRRVADLGIRHAVYGAHDKLAAARELIAPEAGSALSRYAPTGPDRNASTKALTLKIRRLRWSQGRVSSAALRSGGVVARFSPARCSTARATG